MDSNTENMQGMMGKMFRPRMRWFKLVLLLILLLVLVWGFWGQRIMLAMQTHGYQAVFLDNGQVYFGKLSGSGNGLKLTDIYYLQASSTSASLQATGGAPDQTGTSQVQLVKLGSELHGPEDVMYIEKDKVLFWENMKSDSKVVSAITNPQTPSK